MYMFKVKIDKDAAVAMLTNSNACREIERIHLRYPICFYGHVDVYDERGRQRFRWVAGDQCRHTTLPPLPPACFGKNSVIHLYNNISSL